MNVKQSGSVLLPTLIIAGMILALALSLAKIVSNELQFSADLLLGERAYFAAESGVEAALLYLKVDPINLVEREVDLPSSTRSNITIINSVEEFDFVLNPSESLRWRLGVDSEKGFNVTAGLVRNFEIIGDNLDGVLQWKIQCASTGKTLVLQKRAQGNLVSGSNMGVSDDGISVGSLSIDDFLSGVDDSGKCFVSLTNFGEAVITGKVTANGLMAPAQTKVQAIGSSGGREKIIEFEYRQKNLSPFFDFGLLQSE